MIHDLEYFLKFDRPFKRPIDWPTELMYPVALWLFHKPSERRRQIYGLIGQLVCLPARYRAWERKIVTYRSTERNPQVVAGKTLDDDPFFHLLLEMATHYADDAEFDSLLERTITEAPLCTCKSLIDDQLIGPQLDDNHVIGLNYRGSHPLLHDEECPLHFGQIQIIPDNGAN